MGNRVAFTYHTPAGRSRMRLIARLPTARAWKQLDLTAVADIGRVIDEAAVPMPWVGSMR